MIAPRQPEQAAAPENAAGKKSPIKRANEFVSDVFSLLSKVLGTAVIVLIMVWLFRHSRSEDFVLEKPYVSPELEKAGYDAYFITSYIVSRIQEIQYLAQTNPEPKEIKNAKDDHADEHREYVTHNDPLALTNVPPDIRTEVMGVSLTIDQALNLAGQFLGYERKFIRCKVIQTPAETLLYLHMKDTPAMKLQVGNDYSQSMAITTLLDSAANLIVNSSDPITLAYFYFVSGKFELASRCAKNIIDRDHKDKKWAYNLLGKIHNERYEFDRAIAPLQEAIRLDKGFVSALNNLGIAYSYGNHPQGDSLAIATLSQCVKADVDHTYPHARYMLGVVWNKYDSAALALSYFKESLRIDSSFYWSLNEMAYAYNTLARSKPQYYDSSLMVLNKAIRLAAKDDRGMIWTTIGETKLAMGDREAFYTSIQNAIELGFAFRDDQLEQLPYADFKNDERFNGIVAPRSKPPKAPKAPGT
jgi:tetratricopeptide (TPR) repeat protein